MRRLVERAVVLLLVGLAARAPARTMTIQLAPGDSLADAIKQSRLARRQGVDKIQIVLRGGDYPLDKPLILTTEDSTLTIAAVRHETPVITGQTIIRGWKCSRANPNIWQTTIPDVRNGNWIFHELFVNGARKSRTRVPENGFFRMVGSGSGVPGYPTEFQFHPGDIQADWARPGDVEVVVYEYWAQTRNLISQVFANSNIVSLAGSVAASTPEPNCRFFIENAPVALRPGQWHLDLHTGVLSYWPDAGEDVPNATIAAPRLYDLVHIKGDPDSPARDITFRGVTFADTDWRLDGGSDIDSQAAEEIPGAVQAQFARDCAFEHCTFVRMGGYALELDRGCQHNKIVDCDMHDLGAGGIRIGESEMADAVSSPCRSNLVAGNHIHHIGLVSAPGVGILVQLSGQNRIAQNEVDHTYYTAISIGWSWGYHDNPCRSNIVEFNHLHDIGQGMLSDMGGVYTLGTQPGAIVRNNLIHDVSIFGYGGWGLYTDEGSSGIVLESNIVYHCESAGFHQHYGGTNIICNNIFAFNQQAQLARTRIEPHLSFIFTNNIVYFDSGRLLTGNWGDDVQMDHNIYFDTRGHLSQSLEDLRNWQKRGHDLHSLWVDPLFVAPLRGDFRLRTNSPALAFGFGQIHLRHAGP